jgi:hypothetical protein
MSGIQKAVMPGAGDSSLETSQPITKLVDELKLNRDSRQESRRNNSHHSDSLSADYLEQSGIRELLTIR